MRTSQIVRLLLVSLTCVFLLWAALLWLLPASQTVRANPGLLFVTVTGSGTACTQAQPCGLQTALGRAVDGDEVYVGPGTYTGSGSAVVTIVRSIQLLGGWNGAPAGDVQRDPAVHRSTLDGEGQRRVVLITGTVFSRVDGFVIQHGNATAGPMVGYGGGILSYGATPAVIDNVIAENTARVLADPDYWGWGGGIAIRQAPDWVMISGNDVYSNSACSACSGAGGGILLETSPGGQIVNNRIWGNKASPGCYGVGGGLSVFLSDGAFVAYNSVEGNIAGVQCATGGGGGGGIVIESSTAVILRQNSIRDNIASLDWNGYGGAIEALWADDLLVEDNVLQGNSTNGGGTAGGYGGAMYVNSSRNVNISANLIISNTAPGTFGDGGGACLVYGTSFTMTNNIVAGNGARSGGDGLAVIGDASTPVTGTLLHNTFVANTGGSSVSGHTAVHLMGVSSRLALTNNLFSTHDYAVGALSGCTANLNHNLFYADSFADTTGPGSIVNTGALTGHDPRLDAQYHLRAGSPAIDAGVNAGVTTDYDGDARPVGAGYDIGADEYVLGPHATTLFVGAASSGTACSQAQPCALQTALDQSIAGDTLYLAAGTYTGSGDAVVAITQGITVYGGWTGAPSGPVVRDVGVYRSILDGEDLRRGVFITGTLGCTVDGLTIQRGNASSGLDPCNGGGIYSNGAWPLIANNIISGNTACTLGAGGPWAAGGGVYVVNAGATAVISFNLVLGNVASSSGDASGGGVFVYQSQPAQIVGNIVVENTASLADGVGYGGGLCVALSDGTGITRNNIEGNWGAAGAYDGRGGGIYLEENRSIVLMHNSINNNLASRSGRGDGGGVNASWCIDLLATDNQLVANAASVGPGEVAWGGGISIYNSQRAILDGNRFLDNVASTTTGLGGGLSIQYNSSFTMTNNLVARNEAHEAGGGLALSAYETGPVTGTVLHNTFVANNAGSGAGRIAVYLAGDWIHAGLVNNLFSGHSYAVYAEAGGTVTLNRTLFYDNSEGNTGGEGSIVSTGALTGQDPLLDATYHLRAGSPAINAGVDAGVKVDIDGDARPMGAGYDIGADEFTVRRSLYLPLLRRK